MALLTVTVIALAGFVAAVGVVFSRPELMPPGPYHPRSLYCRLLGYDVHPWVRIDPTRSYTLRVWSTRWPIFSEGYGYEDLMDEATEEFRALHPGVDVEYVLLPLGEMDGAIAQAVANSTPPDVCVGPFDPSLVASGFVVPLDMFMRGKEAGDAVAEAFQQSSLRAVSLDGRVWAWPAWTAVRSWAGNAQLLRAAGVDVENVVTHGWTYDDVLAAARAISSRQAGVEGRYKAYALVLDSTSTGSLDTLMGAAGEPQVLDPRGGLAWQGSVLSSALRFLGEAREEKAFPEPVAKMDERMLELFWDGRAAIIGPVGPGFARHVRQRQARMAKGSLPYAHKGVEPVLLPVPHPPGAHRAPCVSVTAASVFRIPGRGGRDPSASRLAVEFAQRLARKEALWLARELAVVPAHLEDRKQVLGMIGPDGASEQFLLAEAASGTARRHVSTLLAEKEAEIRERAIMPALAAFWQGRLDPAEFERLVIARSREILPVDRSPDTD